MSLYNLMVLTGVGGKQGAGLAVDDLLDDGHLHGGWHHAQALHHGVHGGDARHHPKVWVKVWRGRSATDWMLKTKQLSFRSKATQQKLNYYKKRLIGQKFLIVNFYQGMSRA